MSDNYCYHIDWRLNYDGADAKWLGQVLSQHSNDQITNNVSSYPLEKEE